MPSFPELSVIVPSVNGLDDLVPCLEHLQHASASTRLEVVVVDRCGESVRAAVRAAFPDVRLLEAPPGTSIPALRALAIDAATADAIAVIEDHVQVHPEWPRELLDALGRDHQVVGGSVYNAATDTIVDWAAFLCEYGHLLRPLPAGPTTWLPGNNTIYPRALLRSHRDLLDGVHWENHVHDVLRARGVALVRRPDIRVAHKKHFTVRQYATQRYWYSRSWAGIRCAGCSPVARIARGTAALLLPPVLLGRVVRGVWSGGMHRHELVRSLPFLALFVTIWAFGEVTGAWFGPGRSLSRVC